MATAKTCTKCNKPLSIVRMIKVDDRSYKATCEHCGIKFVSGIVIKCKTCGTIIKGEQGVYRLDCPTCGAVQSHWLTATPAARSTRSAPSLAPATPSSPQAATPDAPVKKRMNSTQRGFLIFVVFVAVLAAIGAIIGAVTGGGPSAKYDVYLQGHVSETLPPGGWGTGGWGTGGSVEQIGPADLRVYFTVQNVGKGSGSPTCQITAGNPSSAYYGFDTVWWNKSIPAGGQISAYDDITVTNQGAQYVTQVSVTC
jgi:predicted RNA-binding Zn-ribbon protein involved in translation (DUF1610 family)